MARTSSRTPEMARRVAREVGQLLKTVRRERRVAQDAFAKEMGVSRTTASNIERGRQRLFLDQIYRAAEILGVSINALLPLQELLVRDIVVHAASDDPLPPDAARQVAAVVRELEASGSSQRRTTRKALRTP